VLSLWAVLAGPGDVRVINVFDGVPDGQRPIGWWDQLTRAENPITRAEERHAEDAAALALLGRSAVSLGFVDAQYGNGEARLEPLIECIARALPHQSAVLAPAALGEHPDHRRTRTAALALRERGFPVALYADVPHATPHGWPAWVTGAARESNSDAAAEWERSMRDAGLAPAGLAPQVRALSTTEQEQKRQAVGCYRTQLSGLEASFSLFSRPEILSYEVIWPLPPA
jgi:LmbE family N-acetylglucosaminyl deacetylase